MFFKMLQWRIHYTEIVKMEMGIWRIALLVLLIVSLSLLYANHYLVSVIVTSVVV